MSEKYEPGQFIPSEKYQETIGGGPTLGIPASTTWPNTTAPHRPHCPTCRCRCNCYYPNYYYPSYPYYNPPYYTPWNRPWIVYTSTP